MNRFEYLLAGLVSSALCAGAAAQGVPERGVISLSDPARPATVHLGLIQGSIAVRGTDRKDVLVQSEVDDEDGHVSKPDAAGMRRIQQRAALTVEEENNRVAISAASPNRFYKFTIEVPAKTNLEVSTVNGGEITVEGVDGEIEVGNVNGGITMTRVAGSVVAHTTNGGVKVSLTRVTPQKPMAFTTLNGDVDVTFPAVHQGEPQAAQRPGRHLLGFRTEAAARKRPAEGRRHAQGRRPLSHRDQQGGFRRDQRRRPRRRDAVVHRRYLRSLDRQVVKGDMPIYRRPRQLAWRSPRYARRIVFPEAQLVSERVDHLEFARIPRCEADFRRRESALTRDQLAMQRVDACHVAKQQRGGLAARAGFREVQLHTVSRHLRVHTP